MKLSELQAAPRCTFMGETPDGTVVQCGRWQGHPDDHMSYDDVLARMFTALCDVRGIDPDAPTLSVITVVAITKGYYRRLVVDDA